MKWVRRLARARDPLYLLTAAVTELFLALDAWLAHLSSGTLRANEWIPVWFGAIAGVLLLAAGALERVRRALAVFLALAVYAGSLVVGVVGTWFHYDRLVTPNVSWVGSLLGEPFVWFPPVLAPLTFVLVAVLGASALFEEVPDGSGRIRLLGQHFVQMPLPKRQAYLLLVALGIIIAVVSATLDHGHEGLEDPWMWVATGAGVFAAVAVVVYASMREPGREATVSVNVALLGLALIGLLGEGFHLAADVALAVGGVVIEKFIRGAPPLAPLLYTYVALLGLIAQLPLLEARRTEPVAQGGEPS